MLLYVRVCRYSKLGTHDGMAGGTCPTLQLPYPTVTGQREGERSTLAQEGGREREHVSSVNYEHTCIKNAHKGV